MNEKEIKEVIDVVYKKGYMWQGMLMACYTKEIFERDYVRDLVREYYPSKTSADTMMDTLLTKKKFIRKINNNRYNRKLKYTITKEGEAELYKSFTKETIRVASQHLDAPTPAYKLPDNSLSLFAKKEKKEDCNVKDLINKECKRINDILLDKNKRYGNSSLEPFGLFKSVKRESKIEARIEDKLKRIQKFSSVDLKHFKDYYDAIDDLIGYLILYRIALRGE